MGISTVLSMGCGHFDGVVWDLLWITKGTNPPQTTTKSHEAFTSPPTEVTMKSDGLRHYFRDTSSRIIGSLVFGRAWWSCILGCIFFVFFVIQPTHSAFEFHPVGAQAAGVGDVGVAHVNGAEGLFWNPAAVVFGKGMDIFATYDRPFDLAALESQAVAGSVRWGRQGLGGTYEGFGFELYREQVFGGGYGYRVSDRVGMGLRIRSLALTLFGREKRQWMALDLGVRVLLSDSVGWGVVAWNASGVRTGVLGQGGAMGLAVRVADTANLFASVQKEAGVPTGFGVGVQHHVATMLVLRVGIGSQPERLSAGFGLHRGWFVMDYAGVWHTVLGMSHRVSLRIGR